MTVYINNGLHYEILRQEGRNRDITGKLVQVRLK